MIRSPPKRGIKKARVRTNLGVTRQRETLGDNVSTVSGVVSSEWSSTLAQPTIPPASHSRPHPSILDDVNGLSREVIVALPAGLYQSWLGTVGLAVAVGIAYFMAALFGLALRANTGTSIFWPGAGISVAALIVWGPTARLPVSAGVVVATVVSNLMIGRNTWLAIAFGFVNAGQALLAAGLIEHWFGRSLKLGDVSQSLGFLRQPQLERLLVL